MEDKYNPYEELGDFLAGTFHQDIEPPEEALNEFIMEVTKICIENTKNDILSFLNSNLTNSEKEEFITNKTYIYFPALNLTPIEWLKQTLETLKEVKVQQLKLYMEIEI
ncbi:contact-dependent growth inhibition system immunity protein (plasmid) [Bacillus mycoides]|uniref:contact-dependent growth inhibition system immunity protein n=1 Tax=Bacillus mycoides TaxID=1405 RepID=UPI0024AE00A9|nr:contact-dependent growth inhibition system immunity protein [Bacillus mycoides]MDI6533860.1 contact-dependent growth inhibition system immunity protein [Bacillus mycoides]WJE61347.1 contact-dependent growth inhibition system immunity protein [Bacillus mycoides]WJE67581.1 contact-dependent growth inhibition system immunity protein [Bacillus mycoides]